MEKGVAIRMCGIAGFCNSAANWKEKIEKMNQRMYHRGPDAGGIWASDDKSVVFGHRRLSIIDLSENCLLYTSDAADD